MRYISFTFDDGSITGANKVNEILTPYHATFYIVTGWIKPNNIKINDRFNINIDHGTIEQWKNLSNLGHDIGSHTHTHLKADDPNIVQDCDKSLEIIKLIHKSPHNISSPHFTNLQIIGFDSIRLGTYETMHKKFEFEKLYNNLNDLNLMKLYCCDFEPFKVKTIINQIPDNTWLILAYHSLDGEGFQPISSDDLRAIKDCAIENKYEIKTVREMVIILKK